MDKQRKTVLKSFNYLHCGDFADYLEAMATKGWFFKEWGAGLIFEKGAPEKVTYAVEVFASGSEYDTRPEVHTQEFAEYCQAAGWKLVDAKRKFCIFQKVKEDAEEILTDEERLRNISREEKKELWRQLILAFWFCLLQGLQLSGSSFVNIVFSNGFLLVEFLWLVLAFAAVVRTVCFLIWKGKLRRKILRGEKVFFGRRDGGVAALQGKLSWIPVYVNLFYLMFAVAVKEYMILLYVAGILVPIVLMAYLIAKFRPDAVTNQIIQTIIPCLIMVAVFTVSFGLLFQDNGGTDDREKIPLLYEDIGGDAGYLGDIHLDGSSSVLGSGLRCWLYYEEEHVYYFVYQSHHQWILDRIWKDEMERKYNQAGNDVTSFWDAEQAMRNERGDYLVRYPDRVLILNFAEDTVLSAQQVQTVRRALCESR